MPADAVAKSFDYLDAMADEWARETNIPAVATSLALSQSQVRIEAMLRQSFLDGAYRMYCRAVDDGVIAEMKDA